MTTKCAFLRHFLLLITVEAILVLPHGKKVSDPLCGYNLFLRDREVIEGEVIEEEFIESQLIEEEFIGDELIENKI